jgi:hypothetical protein
MLCITCSIHSGIGFELLSELWQQKKEVQLNLTRHSLKGTGIVQQILRGVNTKLK